MSNDNKINAALDKALGIEEEKPVKKVKTTTEVVKVVEKQIIIEDGRRLLM